MACKLRKAIGAVKDQTSIGLAKVSNAANLEVYILKATTHDEVPMEDRYVNEIVLLVSVNKGYAAACAQSIGKRIGRTRNWVVALKSLMLVLRIFQDGDPYFPREIFHAMKRGAKILNLSTFKDDSTTNSWDYTSFVRTFALYLDERLDCFLTGKLQRRFTYHHEGIHKKNFKNSKLSSDPGIKGMKPTLILDRITHWQKLLDRAIGSRPIGCAKNNSLIKICLYAIVQESFDLYRVISDGLSVILDSFFQLPYKACVIAFKACVKSSKQFDELSGFYSLCSSLGVGRTSEYPSVQKVSDELMETLQEFLKEQASFSADNGQLLFPRYDSKHNLLPSLPKYSCLIPSQVEAYNQSRTPKESPKGGSEYGPPRASSQNLMIASTDASLSSSTSSPEKDEKQSQNDKFTAEHNSGSPIDQTSLCFDLVIFDDFDQVKQHNSPTKDQEQKNTTLNSNNGSTDCWDIVLAEIAPTPKQVEQHYSQTGDLEQKNTPLSSNNGSTGCWDLELAELAPTPKQVEQPNSQTRDQEQKNTTLSSNNGSIDCWDLVLAELASPPKQVEQYNSPEKDQEHQKTTFGSNNGSKDCWDLVLAEIGTKSEHTSSNKLSNEIGSSILDTLFDQPSSVPQPQFHHFLEKMTTIVTSTTENYKAGFANFNNLTPTFQEVVPVVRAQNPPPTFTCQSSNSQTSFAPTVGGLNGFKTSPTFTTEPAFYSPGSYNIGSAPLTFHAHNVTSTTPTFNPQDFNMALTISNLTPQNANKTTVPSTFRAQDFDDTKSEASMFCAKDSSETTVSNRTFRAQDFDDTKSEAPMFCAKDSSETTVSNRDDPVEMWINAMTNNTKHTSNELKQEQSLLQQQQKWLEQQNKIIGMKTPRVAFDLISPSPSSHVTKNNYQ